MCFWYIELGFESLRGIQRGVFMKKLTPLFALVLLAACQKADEAPVAEASPEAAPTEVVEVPADENANSDQK